MSSNTNSAELLGTKLGTLEDWGGDFEYVEWYDFKPAEGVLIPACDRLLISHMHGTWEAFGEDDVSFASGTFSVTALAGGTK